MPRLRLALVPTVLAFLLATLLLGVIRVGGVTAVGPADTRTLGQVQLELDACRSDVKDFNQETRDLTDLYRKAKAGKIVLTFVGASDVPAVIDVQAWGVLIAQRVLAGSLSKAELQQHLKNIAQAHLRTLKVLQEIINENQKEDQTQQAKCDALERERNQLLANNTSGGPSLVLGDVVVAGSFNHTGWDLSQAQAGTVTWNPPWGQAKYEFHLPSGIGDAGGELTLHIHVKANTGTRFAPGMGALGAFDYFQSGQSVGPPALSVLAESGEEKDGTLTVTLKHRTISNDTKEVVLTLGITDGPTIYAHYDVKR